MGQYDFTASGTTGCTPVRVKFHFTSTALVDSITSYAWDFGNGETSTLENPDSVTYNDAGSFSPTLVFNNRNDLKIEKPGLITVHHTVPANFHYYDSIAYNTYVFALSEALDEGTTYTFLWDFEGVGSGTGQREIITFPSADTFQVSLTVSDNYGCTSTSIKKVDVYEHIQVQNIFTPNEDNTNDFFIVSNSGGFPLKLRIFTRAGILVYEAEGSTLTWDGSTASGLKVKSGIYFYSLEALSGDPNKRYTKAGFLYLYR